jgi:thiol-disulfide isomerase/thioredoxin
MSYSRVLFLSSALLAVVVTDLSRAEQTDRVLPATPKTTVAAPASTNRFAPLGAPKAAPLGAPKAALLGAPKAATNAVAAPKFALKTTVGGGVVSVNPDRAAEVKRLLDAFQKVVLDYGDKLIFSKTPEERAVALKWEVSARSVRPIAKLLAQIVVVDPQDQPALDALVFLAKYASTPEISEMLGEVPGAAADGSPGALDPLALLAEHHADSVKLNEVIKVIPMGPATDRFLNSLFAKTHNPEVRALAGSRLIATLQYQQRAEDAEAIALAMSEDRYLGGVRISPKVTSQEWAQQKLRELRTLAIGQTLPEVGGQKLDGDLGQISDYRGKVVVVDVWTTWCGPCVAMIPHENELVEKFKDEPFALLSVSCDTDQELLTKFLETTPMPWDHWWVSAESDFKKNLCINKFPSVFVLDHEGVIRYKDIKDQELETAIESLLKEVK